MKKSAKKLQLKIKRNLLKTFSSLFLDLTKNIITGGFAFILFDNQNDFLWKISVFSAGVGCAIIFLNVSFKYKEKYFKTYE